MFRAFVVSCLMLVPLTAIAEKPRTFSAAKKELAQLYRDGGETFYCGCRFGEAPSPDNPNRTRLTPDADSCGLKPRKNTNRAGRIEWEHVVPAWEFGHQLQCWQVGGRKACQKDPKFREMEADMRNLVPAVGELNGDRSNFQFGMIAGEKRAYGACDFEVDFKARIVEPRPEIRGDIARIYFYMADRYGLKISRQQQRLFESWDRQDPTDETEITRVQLTVSGR